MSCCCCCFVALINLQAATEMMVIKGSCIPPFNPFGGALRDIPKDGCEGEIGEELCKQQDADHSSQGGHTQKANNGINR